MKYIFISDIQWISKEIHIPQNGIFFSCFHVMGNKNYKIWSLINYQNIWSYNLEFLNILYYLMNLIFKKLNQILLLIIKFNKVKNVYN